MNGRVRKKVIFHLLSGYFFTAPIDLIFRTSFDDDIAVRRQFDDIVGLIKSVGCE